MLATVTTTFDLADYFGTDFDARRAKAWATTNIDNDTVHDTSTGETRIGGGTATIASDGTGSFTHWAPGATANPLTWQTYYHFDVPDRTATKGRRTLTLGPFTVTASGELTALVEEQIAIPTATASDYADAAGLSADAADASADSAASSATAAAGSATSASTAETGAETARDETQAIRDGIVGDLGTTDSQTATLVNSPGSLTDDALSGSYAQKDADGRLRVEQRPYSLPAPSGSDDTAAVQAVLDDAVAAGVPVVGPGGATYLVSSINVDNAKGVTLEFGSGAARLGTATIKRTTSGSDSVLSARNSLGLTIKNLRVEYTNSGYTGRLVDLRGDTSDTGMATLDNLFIGSSDSAVHTALGLDLDKTYGVTVRRAHFLYNDRAVLGLTGASGYSNGVVFDTCIFSNSVQHHVGNAGNGWTFLNCIGQQRIGDVGGFYGGSDLTARRASNVVFRGGWYGDVSGGTNAQIEVNGDGFALDGVYMGAGAGVGVKMMVSQIYGFSIRDTKISGSNAGVDYNSFTDGLCHTYTSSYLPTSNAFINGTPPRGSIWESLTPNDGVHIARANIHGSSSTDWISFFNSSGTQRFAIFDSGALRWYNSGGTLDSAAVLSRTAAGVLNTTGKFTATTGVNPGVYTTAGRPSAVTSGEGTTIYDSDLDKLLTSDGTSWNVVAGTGAGSSTVTTYTTPGTYTYTVPTGAVSLAVTVIGGGAGGGSGRRGAAGTVRCGGGGGAGGGFSYRIFRTADLGSTVSLTVGAGGGGGAAVTANDTNGNNGSAGTASTFGSPAILRGGTSSAGVGNGGTNAAGGGGTGGTGLTAGTAGGSASTTGLAGSAGTTGPGPTGGGSGGGISAADAPAIGGAGGANSGTDNTGAAVGAVDGTLPTSPTQTITGGPGSGGAGGSASITIAAQTGAAGGLYGAGGGGGGASLNGNNSGAGGAGAAGAVIVEAFF